MPPYFYKYREILGMEMFAEIVENVTITQIPSEQSGQVYSLQVSDRDAALIALSAEESANWGGISDYTKKIHTCYHDLAQPDAPCSVEIIV